ncbi:MAG: hypothetical protein QOI08_3202 [Actinomycetota bacterium]|nr:hypothetical protein [Actinomycetota bacterium]
MNLSSFSPGARSRRTPARVARSGAVCVAALLVGVIAAPAAWALPPAVPAPPSVLAGDTTLTVSFVPPFDGGSPITSYGASCGSSDGGVAGLASGPSSPLVVGSVSNGKSYTCTVTASNVDGPSLPSAASAAVTPSGAPDAPAQPAVAAGNGRVTVSFLAPFDGGSAITGFGVSCVSSDGGVPGLAAGVASPVDVVGLSNGKSYTCRVLARNANGPGPASPASPAVVPNAVPSAPARPGVVAGNGQVQVSFGAPFNGGRAITGYTAACGSSDGGGSGSASGSRSPLTVTGLTNDRAYTCDVFARNANGAGGRSAPSARVVPVDPVSVRARAAHGFRMVAGDGGVFAFGNVANYGSAAGIATNLVVGMTATRDDAGYWLVATDGGIFSFGNARFYGSTGAMRLNQPVVGMAATPTGRGYWLVASDGGIFSFGDARFYGSTGAIRLNQPIVGMSTTPTGRGYWLVASDGGIFSFGDARFHGSAANVARSRIAGMATTAGGGGYWVAAADGSVYPFGDAPHLGGAPASRLRLEVRGIASTLSGRGYWLVAGDGGIFSFGDAPYFGWPAPLVLARTIRGVSR